MTAPVPPPREADAARVEAARESAKSPGRDRWERALQRYLQISMRQATRTEPAPSPHPAPSAEASAEEPPSRVSPLQALIRAFSSIDLGGIFPRRQQPPRSGR